MKSVKKVRVGFILALTLATALHIIGYLPKLGPFDKGFPLFWHATWLVLWLLLFLAVVESFWWKGEVNAITYKPFHYNVWLVELARYWKPATPSVCGVLASVVLFGGLVSIKTASLTVPVYLILNRGWRGMLEKIGLEGVLLLAYAFKVR